MHRRSLMLLTPLVLAGCGSVLPRQKYIPRTIWPLQPQPPTLNPSNPSGPVLLVRSINAAPGLEQRGLQSLTPEGNLEIDYYNLWAASPAMALTQAMVNWAQACGAFSAVVTPGSRLTPGLIIEGDLSALLVDLSQNEARAEMTILVIKPATTIAGGALPLAQVKLMGRAPLHGQGPEAQAAAQTQAVASLLAQTMAVLARYAG